MNLLMPLVLLLASESFAQSRATNINLSGASAKEMYLKLAKIAGKTGSSVRLDSATGQLFGNHVQCSYKKVGADGVNNSVPADILAENFVCNMNMAAPSDCHAACDAPAIGGRPPKPKAASAPVGGQ